MTLQISDPQQVGGVSVRVICELRTGGQALGTGALLAFGEKRPVAVLLGDQLVGLDGGPVDAAGSGLSGDQLDALEALLSRDP